MKVELNFSKEIFENVIEAINEYLSECELPYCNHITKEDLDEMEDLELGYAAAVVGNAIYKAVSAQTNE